MQRFYGEKRDVHGRVEPYATVSVYESGTDTLATIYLASDSDDTPSTAIPNPLTADANGKYAFAAPNGDYDIVCRGSGAQDYKVRVNLFDSTTSSSGGAGGNNGEVQWNSGGVLTGSPGLTTDGNTLTAKSIQFNTTSPVTSNTQGNTYWDSTYETLSTVLDPVNGVVLQHGQEVHIQCVNKTLATILNGQAVYINDAQGNRPTCALARADSLSTCQVIGIATQDIANNAAGLITVIGRVNGIDTSVYSADGKTLYLSATTAGALTETAPSSPNYVVRVGTNLNTTHNGALFVNPNRALAADTTMAANTNSVPPTQAAAKAYANSAAASALSTAEAYTDTLRSDLASTSDVTKGDKLIGVKSSLTGAVARTQHDKNSDIVSAEDFGATGNGTTDDTDALHAAMAASKAVVLAPGKTYVSSGLTAVQGSGLICTAGRATLKLVGGTTLISVPVQDFTLRGVDLLGPSVTSYASSGATSGTNVGLSFNNASVKGCSVSDCDVSGFDFYGIYVGLTSSSSTYYKSVVFNNVNAYSNYISWCFDASGEYCDTVGCHGHNSYAGVKNIGGNNKFSACNFDSNYRNCWLDTGTNQQHGGFFGCSFNHAQGGGYGLYANGVVNGELFIGCFFWYGDIYLNNCNDVTIALGQIANVTVTVVGGGLNTIKDNGLFGTVTKAFSGFWQTVWKNNRSVYNESVQDNFYPDYIVDAVPSVSANWASTTGAQFTTFGSMSLYHRYGVADIGSTFSGQNGVIPQTGDYDFYFNVGFGAHTGAAAQLVTFTVNIYTDTTYATISKSHRITYELPASATGRSAALRFTEWCKYGQGWKIYIKTSDANGIDVDSANTRLIVRGTSA